MDTLRITQRVFGKYLEALVEKRGYSSGFT